MAKVYLFHLDKFRIGRDMWGQQQQHYIPSQDYFMEHYTAMLLHEAEKLYTKLVKDLTNRVVCDMAFNNNGSTS